jgi:AraC-like DNA-binding protein/quercetin dioxygenase-like cupin family protein
VLGPAAGPEPDPGAVEDGASPLLTYAADYPAGHHSPAHTHFRAQLLYATKGVFEVITGAGSWVVPPQQAVWLPPELRHEVRNRAALSMRSLYVHPDATDRLPATGSVLTVTPLLRELIVRAVGLAADGGPATPERLGRLLAVVQDELESLDPAPLHLPLPTDTRLRRITDRLRAAPADVRTLETWSEVVGASTRTLARLFVRETGMTFVQWRQQLRLHEAVTRLGAGASVTEVTYELGYQSASAFVAMFRRALGAPPARYFRGG